MKFADTLRSAAQSLRAHLTRSSLTVLGLSIGVGASIAIGSLGTAAVRDPALARAALKKYGGEHIVIGIDARDGRVAVQGWVEGSDVTPVDLAQGMKAAGAKYIVYTDISRDGMLSGPNVDSTRELVEKSGMCIIASGGVSSESDIQRVRDAGCEGAIIGKAIYEGRLTLGQALRAARG